MILLRRMAFIFLIIGTVDSTAMQNLLIKNHGTKCPTIQTLMKKEYSRLAVSPVVQKLVKGEYTFLAACSVLLNLFVAVSIVKSSITLGCPPYALCAIPSSLAITSALSNESSTLAECSFWTNGAAILFLTGICPCLPCLIPPIVSMLEVSRRIKSNKE
jgi:hypothetical protein